MAQVNPTSDHSQVRRIVHLLYPKITRVILGNIQILGVV
jgi:hypothetical protein